jgi:methionyl-tRNA synthetase
MLNLPGAAATSIWDEALEPIEAGHKIAKPTPLFHKIESDEKKLDELLNKIREEKIKSL